MPILADMGWNAGLIAIGAGALSFFSPCVAPLVPGYMSYLASSSALGDGQPSIAGPVAWRGRGAPLVRVCLLFVAGFSAAFVALGLMVASFGTLLAAYRPVLQTVAGIVMLAMGAFLLNLLPVTWMRALAQERSLAGWASAGVLGRQHAPGLVPFGLGLLFAAGWTPCIGPVLGSILAYAGASGSLAQGAYLLSLYSLGFALPFVAVGLGWSVGLRALGWLKHHGDLVTKVSGVALMLVGLLYLTGEVAQISIWTQQMFGSSLG